MSRKLVRSRLINNWEATDEPPHLKTIRDRLLHLGQRNRGLLDLYQQILQHGAVEAVDTPEQIELRLSGLVVKRSSQLQVSNRIYATVFRHNWVQRVLADFKADFMQIVSTQEQKLLSMLSVMEGKDFAEILHHILGSILFKLGEMIRADRTTIFFVDEEKNDIWSIIAHNDGSSPDIEIITNKGKGRVANFTKMVTEPFYFRDTDSETAIKTDDSSKYHVYTNLVMPLTSPQYRLTAVLQLVNKLKRSSNSHAPLAERISPQGFTSADEKQLEEYASAILRILVRCQDCYKLTQRLRASEALTEATRSISQSSLDSEEIIDRVMDAAKKLMNADRSTLWLLDRETNQLWTKVTFEDGVKRDLRVQIGQGFVGQVAQSGEPLNIGFDLYDHPDSGTAQSTDRKTGYRTCQPTLYACLESRRRTARRHTTG
ncbi:MAG: GAF domain-containing protein [Leptolyngbyaceae cyanobacterium SM1_3_5]|nr:GAF domain-containing protein [Leptolyngbyaceae cyanobacterium SM1_3_5]